MNSSAKIVGQPCYVLNASTLVMGGALQASVNFIREAVKDSAIDWQFVVSKELLAQLKYANILRGDESSVHIVTPSPARSRASRRKVVALVDQIKPELVFTFFGPAYVEFDSPHLMGVADGWATHGGRLAYGSLSGFLEKLKMFLQCTYKGFWFRRADRWVVEAECARRGLSRRFGIAPARTLVVENSCAPNYIDYKRRSENDTSAVSVTVVEVRNRIVTLSSYYPHKNLEIVVDVIVSLVEDYGRDDFVFVLTLDKTTSAYQQMQAKLVDKGYQHYLETVGPVPVADGPDFYESARVMFLPTLLETFTANYPEAMAMRIPIVTSDLPFAHDICRDAAAYFGPRDAGQAADRINQLLDDKSYASQLVEKGSHVLKKLPSSDQKYNQYCTIAQQLLNK